MSLFSRLWPNASKLETLEKELAVSKAAHSSLLEAYNETSQEKQLVQLENKSMSVALRNALDAATLAREKAADAQTAQILSQDKLIIAMQQMTNYNAFVMGSKIPVFPGVGPERPKVEEVPQEEMPEIKRPRNFRDKMTPEVLTALLNNEWNQ